MKLSNGLVLFVASTAFVFGSVRPSIAMASSETDQPATLVDSAQNSDVVAPLAEIYDRDDNYNNDDRNDDRHDRDKDKDKDKDKDCDKYGKGRDKDRDKDKNCDKDKDHDKNDKDKDKDKHKKYRVDCRYHNTEGIKGITACYASAVYVPGYDKSGLTYKNVRLGVGCDYQTIYNDTGRVQVEEVGERISPPTAAFPAIEITPKAALAHPGTYESTLDIRAGRLAGTCYVHVVDGHHHKDKDKNHDKDHDKDHGHGGKDHGHDNNDNDNDYGHGRDRALDAIYDFPGLMN